MDSTVVPVRFGAWVLKDVAVNNSAGGVQSVTLSLKPQSSDDYECGLPGLDESGVLQNGYHQLTVSRSAQGEVILSGRYKYNEHYTYEEPQYEKRWVEAGRDMCDTWREGHYEDEYVGTVTRSGYSQKEATGTQTLNSLGAFQAVTRFLDNLVVDKRVLAKAAQEGEDAPPNLQQAFERLKAGTRPLQNLLLKQDPAEPEVEAALEQDAPLLKGRILAPVFTWVAEAAKTQVATIQEEGGKQLAKLKAGARGRIAKLRAELQDTRTNVQGAVTEIKGLIKRLTGKAPTIPKTAGEDGAPGSKPAQPRTGRRKTSGRGEDRE